MDTASLQHTEVMGLSHGHNDDSTTGDAMDEGIMYTNNLVNHAEGMLAYFLYERWGDLITNFLALILAEGMLAYSSKMR